MARSVYQIAVGPCVEAAIRGFKSRAGLRLVPAEERSATVRRQDVRW